MNDQLQAELSKFISTLHSGTEFITGQMPDVLSQLLFWHGIKSFIGFSIFIIFTIACYVLTNILRRNSKKWEAKEKERRESCNLQFDPVPYVAMWAIPLFLTTIIFFIFITKLLIWLQIWLTPKAWLVDYITKLAR